MEVVGIPASGASTASCERARASEVIRDSLRLLKEHDEVRLKWREQIERGWLQAQAVKVVDGDEVFRKVDERIKQRGRKRAG